MICQDQKRHEIETYNSYVRRSIERLLLIVHQIVERLENVHNFISTILDGLLFSEELKYTKSSQNYKKHTQLIDDHILFEVLGFYKNRMVTVCYTTT